MFDSITQHIILHSHYPRILALARLVALSVKAFNRNYSHHHIPQVFSCKIQNYPINHLLQSFYKTNLTNLSTFFSN
jgi:hypothetical protein